MKIAVLTFILLMLSANAVATNSAMLHSNEWSVPKKATTIIAMPAIHQSMQALQNNPDSFLTLKYPGGDEGTLWANELRSWLVALGLSSNRIELIPGSAISTTIELEVITKNQ